MFTIRSIKHCCYPVLRKAAAVFLVPLVWGTLFTQVLSSEEQEDQSLLIQSALIYKITRFVLWPEQAFRDKESPIHICTSGKNGEILSRLIHEGTRGEKSQNREITTSYLEEIETDLGTRNCHILFLSDVQKGQLIKMYEKTDTSQLLVIGGSTTLLDAGAMISIFLKENKMALYINIDALLSSSKIKLQNSLFTIGTIV
ncbi:MAG: YfiR family protein, partial [Nitrospinota bacterium]